VVTEDYRYCYSNGGISYDVLGSWQPWNRIISMVNPMIHLPLLSRYRESRVVLFVDLASLWYESIAAVIIIEPLHLRRIDLNMADTEA
jgi:hypothetical protein